LALKQPVNSLSVGRGLLFTAAMNKPSGRVVSSIQAEGGECFGVAADATSAADLILLQARIREKFGHVVFSPPSPAAWETPRQSSTSPKSSGTYNADSYFPATANLLVYTDNCKGSKVTGGILSNTLAATPTPVVIEALKTDASRNISGTVAVTSARSYAITGYVKTSHGRVQTKVEATLGFAHTQNFTITQDNYVQASTQSTTVDTKTTVSNGNGFAVYGESRFLAVQSGLLSDWQ
jgi:hypothetical protein